MAQYEVSCRFLFVFLDNLLLSLPFFIHKKLSISEKASCAIYYHEIMLLMYTRLLWKKTVIFIVIKRQDVNRIWLK